MRYIKATDARLGSIGALLSQAGAGAGAIEVIAVPWTFETPGLVDGTCGLWTPTPGDLLLEVVHVVTVACTVAAGAVGFIDVGQFPAGDVYGYQYLTTSGYPYEARDGVWGLTDSGGALYNPDNDYDTLSLDQAAGEYSEFGAAHACPVPFVTADPVCLLANSTGDMNGGLGTALLAGAGTTYLFVAHPRVEAPFLVAP
jgi:hypothetical protein